MILAIEEVITSSLKISDITKVILATNSHLQNDLSHYKNDLDHWRKDNNHFKSYLRHYKSDIHHWLSHHSHSKRPKRWHWRRNHHVRHFKRYFAHHKSDRDYWRINHSIFENYLSHRKGETDVSQQKSDLQISQQMWYWPLYVRDLSHWSGDHILHKHHLIYSHYIGDLGHQQT